MGISLGYHKTALFCLTIASLVLTKLSSQDDSFVFNQPLDSAKSIEILVINFNNIDYTKPQSLEFDLKGIGNLQDLRELVIFPIEEALLGSELHYEKLTITIPDEISNCKELRLISLNGNNLKEFTPTIGLLSSLEILEMAGCKFLEFDQEEFVKSISNLKKLKTLNVYGLNLREELKVELISALPQCQFFFTFQDIKRNSKGLNYSVYSEVNKSGIRFDSEQRASQFLKSLRSEIIDDKGVYLLPY